MTEIENLKASVALWVNAASSKVEEFILNCYDAEKISDLDFKLLGQIQADLDRARKFLIIKDDQED